MSAADSLRIAHIAPVATTIPPPKSGSVEFMTSLLTEGLVAAGHDVTLFATANSTTTAKLHAIYPHGYWHDENMWPWELYEMLNLSAAIERAADFDLIHYEAAFYPDVAGVRAAVADPDHPDAPPCPESRGGGALVALSGSAVRGHLQRAGPPAGRINVIGTVLHGLDTDNFTVP
jgi:hypothetical protein